MDYHIHCPRRVWIFILSLLIILDCYFHIYVYYNVLHSHDKTKVYDIYKRKAPRNDTIRYYKYQLVNSAEALMDYNKSSSYYWFKSMKHLFRDISAEAAPEYSKDTPVCKLNTSLEPILVMRSEPKLELIERQNPDLKLGGYHAPAHCRATQRVAIIVPYRDRRVNLYILLRYLHPLLKNQLLEYRIFVVEQNDTDEFNKGTLYNIAFLETQRFGTWDCLILHDVDLIPEDERISYSCREHPTRMSPSDTISTANKSEYRTIAGRVTALTPEQYESVNGYSNLFWGGGLEDDDFYDRIEARNYTIMQYNNTIARYATLRHPAHGIGKERILLLAASKLRIRREGLITTKYQVLKVTQEKLYTHILADVSPMKIDSKSLIRRINDLGGSGYQELKLKYSHMLRMLN